MPKIFGESLEQFGIRTAFITESGEEITYADFLSRADEIASHMPPIIVICWSGSALPRRVSRSGLKIS